MREALTEACHAQAHGEVPVGAVVVAPDGTIIGRGHNAPIALNDPTAHAEIMAIRQATGTIKNYRLTDCILAVTLEPCLMCTGAIVHARLRGIIFGAFDSRSGAVSSQLDGFELALHNHSPWQAGGILETECAAMLHSFFAPRRM